MMKHPGCHIHAVLHAAAEPLRRLLSWTAGRTTPRTLLFLVAGTVGLISGAAAALLKLMIAWVSTFLTEHFHADGVNWWLIVLPIAGILLTGVFMRYILCRDISHGTDKVKASLMRHDYDLGNSTMFSPMIASAITLGFGGSAGSEGPIATTGAALGSGLGRASGVSDDNLRVLIGCGAAAGIAGIFKAPVGGFLYALEVLGMELSTVPVIAAFIACLISGLTAYALSGFTLDIELHQPLAMEGSDTVALLLLGVFCGLYSGYYRYVMRRMSAFFENMSNPLTRNLLAGLLIGVAVFLFPALYGEGYGIMGEVINGDPSRVLSGTFLGSMSPGLWQIVAVAGGIIAVKCFATAATTSGGGVAGEFAPALFAGCMAGLFFGVFANVAFGAGLDMRLYAYAGMAAVMAGALRAPLMSIFLVVEMTGSFTLLLPVTIATAASVAALKFATGKWRVNKGVNVG